MDKVFIFHLPEIAEKLQGEYEVISGNNFKDAARKASPPLTDKLAFSIIKNQEGYGFPADKWVKLAVEKLGPVLIVGRSSLSGIDGANYCDSVEDIYSALSSIGIEVSSLAPSADFSGLFSSESNTEQPEDSFDLPGIDGGYNAGDTDGFALPGVDTAHTPAPEPATSFALPGISEQNTSLGSSEQVGVPGSSVADETPTTTLPVTQAQLSPLPSAGSVSPTSNPVTDYALPGVEEQDKAPGSRAGVTDATPGSNEVEQETSQSGYALPGVTQPPATGYDLPDVTQVPVLPDGYTLPDTGFDTAASLYDDIELAPVTPGSSETPSWEDQPAEPSWRPTRDADIAEQYVGAPGTGLDLSEQYVGAPGSSAGVAEHETSWRSVGGASEPDRPAPAPPIAPAANPHTVVGGCPTIIVFGAKGGVGKTTTSIHLAQRAGKLCPDMRVTLIDANRGQGDIRTKLRTLNVPTIFDALPEEGRGAIITPPALDKDRPAHLEPLAFALIAAPPSELSDPSQVTPQVYQNALSEARSVSDLVIVDTQISEKYDTTKLFENFLIPLLIKDENAWGVGATEDSPESINNLLERLHQYRTRGVKPGKIFTLIAQAHAHNTPEDLRDFESMFDQASSFAGAVPYNKTIYNRLSSGILCESIPQVAAPLDRILYAVTGKGAFTAKKTAQEKPKKKKRRRFGKRR